MWCRGRCQADGPGCPRMCCMLGPTKTDTSFQHGIAGHDCLRSLSNVVHAWGSCACLLEVFPDLSRLTVVSASTYDCASQQGCSTRAGVLQAGVIAKGLDCDQYACFSSFAAG